MSLDRGPARRRVGGRPLTGARHLARLALSLALLAAGGAALAADAPETRTLANGLALTVFPDHRLPIVTTKLLVRSGTAHETPSQAGLAALAARGLLLGTAEVDARTLLRTLEASAAEMTASASYDYSLAELRCHRRDWERLTALFADALEHPEYPESEWSALRARTVSEARQAANDPRRAAGDHLDAMLHGSTPYGRPLRGDANSLSGLEAEDARAFHAAHWLPHNAHLLIAGDVEMADVLPVVERLFGRWERANIPLRVSVPRPTLRGPAVRVLDAQRSATAILRIGCAGPSRRDPDYLAAAALHVWLGAQNPESRLTRLLTERLGGPPLVQSSWSFGAEAGSFQLGIEAPLERARMAVDAYREVARELRQSAPSPTEMGQLRQALLGAAALTQETPGDRAERWALSRLYGLPSDFQESYAKYVRALSPADVQRVARRFLGVDTIAVVAVGPADALRTQFAGLATPTVQILGSATGAIPALAMALPASPARDTPEARRRGRAVVDSMLAAHGGAGKLRQVSTWRLAGSLRIGVGPTAVNAPFAEIYAWPDRWRNETARGGAGLVRTLDGTYGWTSDGGTLTELDPAGVEGLRLVSYGLPLVLFRKLADPDAALLFAGLEKRQDAPMQVVDWLREDGGYTRLYLHAGSKLLQATEQTERADGERQLFQVLRLYDDIRPVEGIQYPYTLSTYVGELPISTVTAERLELGVAAGDETFRPSLR